MISRDSEGLATPMTRPEQQFPWPNRPELPQTHVSESSEDSVKHERYLSEYSVKKMRLRMKIRDQLCLLILITNLLALMVLAVSTWYQTVHHLRSLKTETLTVTANLKADQVAQQISLFQSSVQQISTRSPLQTFLREFNNGNHSQELYDGIMVGI
jgi:hypothetical protein